VNNDIFFTLFGSLNQGKAKEKKNSKEVGNI